MTGDGPLPALRVLCENAAARLGGHPAAAVVTAVARRLAEPALRVAVGGRLKAGKSTIVNALVGHTVAATATTECTTLVARFRPAAGNRVVVHDLDGTTTVVPGRPGGGMPSTVAALGVAPDRIRHVDVELADRRMPTGRILIDTPGIDSLTGLDDVALAALADADALLYVMPHPGEGDVEAIGEVRRLARTAHTSLTAATVIGVLSRVDELGDGSDPAATGERIARNHRRRLAGLMATVVPVNGLLAESALAGVVTEHDATLVNRLRAVSRPPLRDAASFLDWDSAELTRTERRRLLDRFAIHGVREVVRLPRSGPLSAATLRAELRRLSGADALLSEIDTRFTGCADRLRARSAFTALQRLPRAGATGRQSEALATLRAGLRDLRLHPALRQGLLQAALADLATGRLDLPAADSAALQTLATAPDPVAALGGPDRRRGEIDRWRRLETALSATTRRHARTAREYCEYLI
ncbi:GTPase [Actinoplanes sp. HUAS TT8]|uniref:GTPase n=1 Tax=Actinoplanes sp. HUAS TT8 TaxID=3447453 RepID=UPI003F51B3A4